MPSPARQRLQDNAADLERLWEIHEQEVGAAPGRKYGVEVLNKAVVVLTCAAWEAFCEDLVSECVAFLVEECPGPDKLPDRLRTFIAKQLEAEDHDHAVWKLAGDGWKQVIKASADDAVHKLTGRWNTPKARQIQDLFDRALGIDDITENWAWHKNAPEKTREELDEFVSLRGAIAHRMQAENSVQKWHGTRFYDHISRLADKMDETASTMLVNATGQNPGWL